MQICCGSLLRTREMITVWEPMRRRRRLFLIFLGDQLEDVIEQLVSTGEATHSLKGGKLKTGVRTLPDLAKDATDRNRTSPFAFTGNKFEFRMVGSRDSVAGPNVVLNTIVAEAFSDACDVLEQADNFEMAVHDLIKQYAIEHQRIIFNGNGYSEEWVEEAERRGSAEYPVHGGCDSGSDNGKDGSHV